MKKIGIYIHVPFCKSKCYYCDFNSYAGKDEYIEKYVNTVIQELENNNLEQYEIETVYFGGGTPSVIDEKYIEKILKSIDISKAIEVTIEVNPATATLEKLKKYKDIGINRVSIGLQSTCDMLLQKIGRVHKYIDFKNTYNDARTVGFKNISFDLMLGLPNQTIEILEKSLNEAVKYKPEHISIYSFILEEGTKFYQMYENNKLELLSEELDRKMYWIAKNFLQNNGYEHYEVSNFAINKQHRAKYNTNCWKQHEYIGIGAGAHSFVDDKRYRNSEKIEEYINNNKITIEEELTKEDKMREYVILSLRMIEGFKLEDFYKSFDIDFLDFFKKEYQKLIDMNLIVNTNNSIRLTNKGIDLANIVWQEFV